MLRTNKTKQWMAGVAFSLAGLFGGHAVQADTVILTSPLTNDYQSGNKCTNCGPFGEVTVSSTSNPDQVLVSLTLASNEVFAIAGGNGAGKPLLFDIAGSPTNMSITMVQAPTGTQASWFSLNQTHQMVMADGTGIWDDAIFCNGCANGTTGGYSGTLSFYLTATTPLTAASFVANTSNNGSGGGLFFGTDIGVSGGTGDVAAPSVNVVPLPETAWLLVSGLGGLGFFWRQARGRLEILG